MHILHVSLVCTLAWKYVCAYLLLHHGEHAFYRFRAGNVNSVTLSNKFIVSYGDIQMTMCILTL